MNARLGRLAAVTLGIAGKVAGLFAPWRDLAARLVLAQAFLVAALPRMMGGPALPHLPGTLLAAVATSQFGLAAQLLAPALLALGLLGRGAALALLLQLALLPWAAPGVPKLAMPLLGWVLVAGPGALALDGLFAPAMTRSALPGAAALARAYAASRRYLAPALLLVLRLWLAAVVAAPQLGVVVPWLAPPPVAALPPQAGLALAAALLAGFAVPPVALVLAALALDGGSGAMAMQTRLFWVLTLALPLLEGGGLLSLDSGIAGGLRRRFPAVRDLAPEAIARLPRVVIVGAGFGGIAAARALAGAPCRVTLIDRRNFTLFQPLLYQVATAGLSPADIATPIRAMFRDQPQFEVLLAEVRGIDAEQNAVVTDGARVPFDFCIVATGARHAYFGRDDWAADAPGLKQVEDATEIRRRLLSAFEAAERAEDAGARAAWLTFVVVGGGPTGVELAGAVAELAHHSLADEFRHADPRAARVILVQSDDRVLPAFPPALSARAAAALARLHVEVRTGARVTGIDERGVMLGDERIGARTVLWAAGVMASPAAAWLGVAADRAGRVPVAPDLRVPGRARIFAIGDTVASTAWGGRPVPGLAPAAKQQGVYAARAIRRALAGKRPPGPFRYHHYGSLATIGRQAAVADFGWLRLSGAVAWWLWGGVHLAFLLGGRNRAAVLVSWLWAYLTYRSGSRLITGAMAAER